MKKLPRLVKVISCWLLVIGFLFFAAASLRSIKAQEEVKIPGPDLEEASFITVEDLQVGDWVFVKSDENGLAPEKITKLKWIEGSIEVYNLTVEEEETFFADSFAVHNKACTGITYSLSPSSPPANTTVTVNISRVGATPCSGNWNSVGLLLDGVPQGIGLCHADGSNCSQGYHAYINSGGAGTHTLKFTVNSGACSCNSYSFTTTAAPPTCTGMRAPSCINVGKTFTVSALGVQNATSVRFPTWDTQDGQEDIVWYSGSQSGSTWSRTINQSAHPKGNINVHVYMYNADHSNVWCAGRNNIPLCCAPHASYACSSNDVYWYDSCGNREEKKEECYEGYWADEYQCSGNTRQRKYVRRGCSVDSCYSRSEWINYENCGGDYWTNKYRCSGNMRQRKIIRRGCRDGACYNYSEWVNIQNCGGDYWTNEYRCSGNMRQRKYVHRGCSGSSCYSWSEWRNIQDCGSDYWTDEYRCAGPGGTIKQRKIIRRGCSGSSCYNYPEWLDVGLCCVCSGWSDQDCGQWECPATKMHQTQSCNPGGCDDEDQCVDNPQCVGTVSGYIWNDANNSDGAGKDPPGEQNYTASTVTVRYSCPSGDSSVDTSNGNYSFSNVPPEACSVLIDTGDLATGWSTTTLASVGVIVPGGGTVTANFGVWDNPKPWFQGCSGGVYGLGVSVSVPYECQGCCDRWLLGADPNTAGGVVVSGNATLSCDGRCSERGSSPGWNVKNQVIDWPSSLSFSSPPGATTITSKDPVLDPGKSYIWDRSELPAGSNKYQLGSGVAVLYVNGNLTINGKFNSDNPQTQGVILVVNGSVTINRDNAGDSLADTGSDLDVAIIAKGTISITGSDPKKRVIVKGSLYGKGGISVTGEELEDNRYPRLQTIYNPLYFDPSNPLAKNSIIWREIAP